VSGKKKTGDVPNFRTAVKRAAADASVPVNDYERALVLGQVAELLAAHSSIGGRIAFKGGAIMRLIDGSPRLSRDLDASLVSGRPITEAMVREALSTPAARKVVIRVDKFVTSGADAIRFPVVACHPLSGQGEVTLQISINWSNALLCVTEIGEFEIDSRTVALRVMARRERVAEKVRAFLDRGEDRDAFDLHYFVERGLKAEEWKRLPSLISTKLQEDRDLPDGLDLIAEFDQHIKDVGEVWGKRGGLTLIRGRPVWAVVKPNVVRFRDLIPPQKPVPGHLIVRPLEG
jgi:predicted nucleotidyltransferase component of viral defense system